MVLEAGILDPSMVLEGCLLVVLACWKNNLSAPRDAPLAGGALKKVLTAEKLAPLSGHPCLCWQGHSFCAEVVILEGFCFVPSVFSQDHSLSAVMAALEEGLIPSPALLCMGVMVLECPFPDPAFLSRMMFCKTLKLSFSSISLFGRKWWS